MMIRFFEGIDSERGIAWRLADSLMLRQFLQIVLDERTPDHVDHHSLGRRSLAPGMCLEGRAVLFARSRSRP